MHQIRFGPLTEFKGPTSKGREGIGRGGKGWGGDGKGRRGRGEGGTWTPLVTQTQLRRRHGTSVAHS